MTDEREDDTNAEITVRNGSSERKERVNYPPNSHRSKEEKSFRPTDPASAKKDPEPKKVEKVISGQASTRKKGLGRKIRDTFTGDDMQSVGNFILFDVVVPTVKQLIVDIGTQSLERTFYGSARPSGGRSATRSQTNYSGYYKPSGSTSPVGRAAEPDGPRISSRARANHEFEDIELATRGDADLVLDKLDSLIRQYEVATVSDLYDAVGLTGSFTDDRWGWTSMAGSGVERTRGGRYILVLPKTEPIN